MRDLAKGNEITQTVKLHGVLRGQSFEDCLSGRPMGDESVRVNWEDRGVAQVYMEQPERLREFAHKDIILAVAEIYQHGETPSVTNLSKYLKVSRSTLYRRVRRSDCERSLHDLINDTVNTLEMGS